MSDDIDREAVLLEARKAADIAYSIAEVLADDVRYAAYAAAEAAFCAAGGPT